MPPNVIDRVLAMPAGVATKIELEDEVQDKESPLELDLSFDTNEDWVCPASKKSVRTSNPIRSIVDPIVASSVKSGKERGDGKDQISLALGDPTAYGNLPPCPAVVNAITTALQSSSMAAGYVNACGTNEARAAIASYHSCANPRVDVSPDDVVVANGCSGALELALTALLDEGSILLVPRPGFPLYQVIAESHGARVLHYDLLPDNGWQCDLDHMESLITEAERFSMKQKKRVVRGIVINNPSNPTGSVYSEDHLRAILALAYKYRLPIVADEIYGDLTYGDSIYRPLAEVSAAMGRKVPIITASGLGKQFLVPGWRVGWIVFHDNTYSALREVRDGAKRLAQVILGASHLAQCAVPAVLAPSSASELSSVAEWRAKVKSILSNQATFTYDKLCTCHGLLVNPPSGAMYVMVKIQTAQFDEGIHDDVSFTKLLLEEENVFVLPGKAFGASKDGCQIFRVVFGAPIEVMEMAFKRIAEFCERHGI